MNCSGTSGPASRAWPDLRKLCLEKIISSINSSLRQETIIKGLSCHDSSWTERGGGDLVKVDTITLQPARARTSDQPQTWTNGGSQYQDLDRNSVTLNWSLSPSGPATGIILLGPARRIFWLISRISHCTRLTS